MSTLYNLISIFYDLLAGKRDISYHPVNELFQWKKGIVIELYSEKTWFIYTETYYSQKKVKYSLKYQ